MKKQQGPCLDLCDFSGPKGWCLGCGRTKAEARTWQGLKPYDRQRTERVDQEAVENYRGPVRLTNRDFGSFTALQGACRADHYPSKGRGNSPQRATTQ
ncbi:MAG: hypothetical protein CBB81_10830 [Cellvibrionales bacterium TMED21]|nr:hypothetical protein [Halieaceae bacterium]OUT63974.1 MAG: hypothetical protein CBB81_10830 [Cellvibrionales bacterium TMED21]